MRRPPLGAVEDNTAWKAIFELYLHDKVEEALDLIQRTGAGEAGRYLTWSRMVEAEAVSRRGSDVRKLASYLEVEFIPDETPGGLDPFVPTILNACARVSRSLRFAHGPPTRIAFLSEAANAPWATSPHGYCMDMFPFEKLCMPSRLFRDPSELAATVAHEYAHVATLNTTQGRVSRWLDEAMSMQFEPHEDGELLSEFVSGEASWNSPNDLTIAFGSEYEDEVWEAYQQSMWIGRFLRAKGGNESLAKLQRTIGQDRPLSGIWARVRGWTGDEFGLRSVFGLSQRQAFDQALSWLRSGQINDPGPFPGVPAIPTAC